ncbi:MAG: alpha/beta fold hydrolase [Trebonia sp.]
MTDSKGIAAGWKRWSALALAAAGIMTALSACGSPALPAPASVPAGTPPIAAAPVRVAKTTLGDVGYRIIGNGPPLVLIMGYGGSMETWDTQFADTLVQHNRVVIFDNAGIGSTQALPGTLTIDAMADQTSALISALGLGRPDVLGWSMGGMIAQALAVRHPAQVRRLVLSATYPGVGTDLPPQANVRALTNGNGQAALGQLFPADQAMAAGAFTAVTSAYPAAFPPPAATVAAQLKAILEWAHGTDPAGRLTSRIGVPTLVADGTADRLVPVANAYTLARTIPGARLVLYPDAGHAFLFQEGASYAFLVESFLGGRPQPLSVAAIRSEFAAGEARIEAAGTRWADRVKRLPSNPTTTGVTDLDEPFASALSDLDYELLAAGATGKRGAAITAYVTAGERLSDDILALAAQSKSTVAAWTTTAKADAEAREKASAAQRKVLGLPPAQ